MRLDLSFGALRARYLDGTLTPVQLVTQLHAQILAEEAELPRHVWIHRLSLAELTAHALALAAAADSRASQAGTRATAALARLSRCSRPACASACAAVTNGT